MILNLETHHENTVQQDEAKKTKCHFWRFWLKKFFGNCSLSKGEKVSIVKFIPTNNYKNKPKKISLKEFMTEVIS